MVATGQLAAFDLLLLRLQVAFPQPGPLPGPLVAVVHPLPVTVGGAPRPEADLPLRMPRPALLLRCLGLASPPVLAPFPCTIRALPARPWVPLLCNRPLDLDSNPTRGTGAAGPGWTLPRRRLLSH
jgi:hypothetical protein